MPPVESNPDSPVLTVEESLERGRFLSFVRNARRGARRGASGGEKACHEIAATLLQYVTSLDAQSLAGLIVFANEARSNWPHVAELCDF